jgi:hypothetical protein
MTLHRVGLRTLSFLCSEFVRRLRLPHRTDHHGSRHKRRAKRQLVDFRVVRQLEQERCTIQEGLDSAQRAIDQTLTLIKEAQDTRVRAHIRAMLSHVKSHRQNSAQRAA